MIDIQNPLRSCGNKCRFIIQTSTRSSQLEQIALGVEEVIQRIASGDLITTPELATMRRWMETVTAISTEMKAEGK